MSVSNLKYNWHLWKLLSLIIPDKPYVEFMYKRHFGKNLDLNNPRTFNEKIQWLKLYDRNPLYPVMVDKIGVKEYVAQKIGAAYVIPTLGIWNDAEKIDFDILPNQFVLKWNHDSGSTIICKNKEALNRKETMDKMNKYKSHNGYYYGREWPYKQLKPQIICEAYMEDQRTKELRDYKFFCFNGHVKAFKIDFDRFTDHHANYFDRDCNFLPFEEIVCPSDATKKLEFPSKLDEMIELAEELSSGIPFIRVDFYYANGNIYFGELTLYPMAGFGRFNPDEWDAILGSWIDLPINTED